MKRTPRELRENTTLTGEEQAKNDNLTVEELSINSILMTLIFLLMTLKLTLILTSLLMILTLIFSTNKSRTEERTESEQRENAKINCERTVRTKHERSPRKTILKSRGSRERSQEEAVKNPLEAVRKR